MKLEFLGCNFGLHDFASKRNPTRFARYTRFQLRNDFLFSLFRLIFKHEKPMIIALTASVTEQEVNAARDAGCNDVLSKPVKRVKLLMQQHSRTKHRNKPRFVLGAQPHSAS
jgi:hypothetical protein